MRVDALRMIGSPQTNRVMQGEASRIVRRALARRLDEPRREGTGQLLWPFDAEVAQALLAYARTPTRLVRDLYKVRAMRLEPLYEALCADMRDDDRAWAPGRRLSVEVRRMDAFGGGDRQVVGVVKNALADAYPGGAEFVVDALQPDTPLVARLDDAGDVVVSLDLGGGSLARHGWRREQGDAPLREHLAAVLVMLTRFDPRVDVLLDPMCGSGTIPIEAALMARGEGRAGAPPLFPDAAPLVIGADVDFELLQVARQNAARAHANVEWLHQDVTRLRPEHVTRIATQLNRTAQRGVILCNPPYGERLVDIEVSALYDAMFDAFASFSGWRVGVLGPPELEAAGRGRLVQKKPLANGNLRTYFFLYEM